MINGINIIYRRDVVPDFVTFNRLLLKCSLGIAFLVNNAHQMSTNIAVLIVNSNNIDLL